MRINQKQWDEAYSLNSSRHKNKYPSELIVSWVLRNHGEGGRCLDMGCGFGNNLRFLLENGFDALGFDFSPSVIENIKNEFGDRVCVADAIDLPYPNSHFDFLIDRSSLQHNPAKDLGKIFDEAVRVLKPDGAFFSCFLTSGNNGFLLADIGINELGSIFEERFYEVLIDYQTTSSDGMRDVRTAHLITARNPKKSS